MSVSEIVERLTDPGSFGDILKYVELTDVDKAIDRADEIDAADPNGIYASSFREYVLVLRDYVAECVEHGFSGNLHMHLNSADVHGRKCPGTAQGQRERHRAEQRSDAARAHLPCPDRG